MYESKYLYNGISLSRYCKDNGININYIQSRIWKKKHNAKYANYTDQEIVNMVIEAYGTSIKYMYNGMSLSQYCKDNGISIKKINARIDKLKKKNANLSNDELVTLAMDEFTNQKFKFFYDGIPLKEYCKDHPEIKYETIRTYINREKQRNPNLSDKELIEQFLNKKHKGIYRYYYQGTPLKQYCDEHNLNYKNIIRYISKYRNTDEFKNLSDDEFVETIMKKYHPSVPKYLYNGVTLREYCLRNNLSYYSVLSFVKRSLAKDNTKNIADLIDEGIKTINRYGIIYYYKGIPLKDYAKQNNLNATSIRSAILKKQAMDSTKSLQEIVNECVESYQKFSIKYYYNGMPLLKYCQMIGLNYNTVVQKYLYEYADNTNISTDEAIKRIVDYYLENPPLKTKYYFNNQSLAKFCDINGYPYLAIWRRIKTLESKNELDNNEIISTAIKKYEDKLQINKISEAFNKLKDKKINNINEIKAICTFLKIDFENVIDLVEMDFSYNQAINMIWYFSDKKTSDDYKIITDKKIKDIFTIINNLRNSNIDIEKFELYDLIGIYKSELYDSRNEILLKLQKYISHTIFSLCRIYEINIDKNNYEEFESEIKYYLLILINRISLNQTGQIIKYMDLTIKGYFRTFLKEYKKQNSNLSLDNAKYSSDKNTRNEKAMIDYIADSNNFYEDRENSLFSFRMMKVLSTLPAEDLAFIMLKYQENYSDEELANHFNLTITETKQKELEILALLKNQEGIKELKKLM